jgi:hypothetical protein
MESQATERLEILAPFLSKSVLNELCSGRHWAEYRERRIQVLQGQVQFGIFAQNRIARYTSRCSTRFVEGLGQWKACIDPDLYFAARAKYGEDCWKDKDFLNDTLKKTPECRVPAPAPRLHRVQGFKKSRHLDRPISAPANGAAGDPPTAFRGGHDDAGHSALAPNFEPMKQPAPEVLTLIQENP